MSAGDVALLLNLDRCIAKLWWRNEEVVLGVVVVSRLMGMGVSMWGT